LDSKKRAKNKSSLNRFVLFFNLFSLTKEIKGSVLESKTNRPEPVAVVIRQNFRITFTLLKLFFPYNILSSEHPMASYTNAFNTFGGDMAGFLQASASNGHHPNGTGQFGGNTNRNGHVSVCLSGMICTRC
jgi:hypothetical protein